MVQKESKNSENRDVQQNKTAPDNIQSDNDNFNVKAPSICLSYNSGNGNSCGLAKKLSKILCNKKIRDKEERFTYKTI